MLYDIHTGDWSEEILAAVEETRDILPPLYDCADVIGHVTAEAADVCGLAEGIPVVAGTVDSTAGAIESGIVRAGQAFEATGTSSVFAVTFDKVVVSPYLSASVGLHKECGSLFGAMSACGASYKWCRDVLFGGENEQKNAYDRMNEIVEKDAPDPTKIIFLPYMSGERSPIWNSDARGVFFGIDLGTKQGQLLRAVMEGTSFSLRDNIEAAR